MSVTKRTRFEVLKRDGHACRYCGRRAPDVALTVDHVIPVSLGGSDSPSNLVAACADCNAGKSSSNPDAGLVEDVGSAARLYSLALTERLTVVRERVALEADYLCEFTDRWTAWRAGGKPMPLPLRYRAALSRWCEIGIPIELVLSAVDKAMEKQDIRGGIEGRFAYLAGIIWRTLDNLEVDGASLTPETVHVYTEGEAESWAADEWRRGMVQGYRDGRAGKPPREWMAPDVEGATVGS